MALPGRCSRIGSMVWALSDSTAKSSDPFCVSAATAGKAKTAEHRAYANALHGIDVPIDASPDIYQLVMFGCITMKDFASGLNPIRRHAARVDGWPAPRPAPEPPSWPKQCRHA